MLLVISRSHVAFRNNPYVTRIYSDHTNLRYFTTKQMLTRRQARWSLFLATFDYLIIPKPGKTNKADGLSRHPDYKEGIASENTEKVLLTPDKFGIQSLHTTAIPVETDNDLKLAIQMAITNDKLTGQKLKDILTSKP